MSNVPTTDYTKPEPWIKAIGTTLEYLEAAQCDVYNTQGFLEGIIHQLYDQGFTPESLEYVLEQQKIDVDYHLSATLHEQFRPKHRRAWINGERKTRRYSPLAQTTGDRPDEERFNPNLNLTLTTHHE